MSGFDAELRVLTIHTCRKGSHSTKGSTDPATRSLFWTGRTVKTDAEARCPHCLVNDDKIS